MAIINIKDEEVQRKCSQFIADAKKHSYTATVRENAKLFQDFFKGGKRHWTEDEYNQYKSKGVEPITVNRCKPVVKSIHGMYLQSKQDIKVRPRRNGSENVAQIYTEVLKHAQDVSLGDYVYATAFLRGCIDTETFLKLRIDKSMNPNGQPIIEAKTTFDIDIDRNATEYDLNISAKYIIEKEWLDKDELFALYPEKNDEISGAIDSTDAFGQRAVDRLTALANFAAGTKGTDTDDEDENTRISDSELVNQYRYLLRHVHWKEIKPALLIGDKQDGTIKKITDEKQVKKLSRKAKKTVRFEVIPFADKKLHETIMFGEEMLEDRIEPLGEGVTDFPIVRYSPIFEEGYTMGVLDDIVPLNKEENINRTQMTRLLNQTTNSGWIVGDDTNKEAMKVLSNFGSVPGIVVGLNKLGGKAEKIQPNQLAVGHYTQAQQFEQDVKRVSSVDDATQGYSTNQTESGRAIGLKMQNNMTANQIIFDNFYYTLEIFGNTLLKSIIASNFYTSDEIRMIVSESTLINHEKMQIAEAKYQNDLLGAGLPKPQIPTPPPPEFINNLRIEDKPKVLEQIKKGLEGAQMYMEKYPALKKKWDADVKRYAVNLMLEELKKDKGMYGIKVTISASTPTERITQFLQMSELMKNYGQIIPLDVFIDMTDLPQKEEIIGRIKANQAMAQQQPQQVRAA